MPKALKYAIYVSLFVFSFFIFLYWTFPYDLLKERLISAVEQQLGEEYDMRIESFLPSFFTGAVLKQVKIIKHGGDATQTVWEAQKVKIRSGLSAMLFGRTSISFSVKNQKSYMSGNYKKTDDGFSFYADFDDFNIGDLGALTGDSGLKIVSAVDGTIKLNINKRQMIQSTGSIDLSMDDLKIKAGELRLGEGGTFQIPELVFSKGSGSVFKCTLSKGAIRVTEFKLQDGDLRLEVSGDVFMSSSLKNYRMNLKGIFASTPKLEQAVPFLFMIEKQRQPDGTYPLAITGRIAQPSIKIGEFTLPI